MAVIQTYPSLNRAVGVAKEPAGAVGTPVNPVGWIPVDADGFNWNDKPTWLRDKALRAAMGDGPFNVIQGVQIGEIDMKGPAFGDELGYLLGNILGEVVESGTSIAPTGTLASSSIVGATSVSSLVSIPNTTLIQIDVGVNSEIVTTNGAPTGAGPFTIPVPALAKPHASGVAITAINAAPINHAFGLLNGLGPAVTNQPTTHTFTQYYGPTPSSGARQFAATCFSDLGFQWNAESEMFKYTAKAISWASQPMAGAPPVPAFTSAKPLPSWQVVLGIGGPASGGTQVKTAEAGEFSIKRQLKPFFTGQNSQNPYITQRGGLSADGWKLSFIAADESVLNYMRNNTQPQIQLIISNGLSGANLLSFQFDLQVAAFTEAKPNFGAEAIKFDATGDAVFNTTNAGYSGGTAPIKVTLGNAIPALTYI